MGIPVNPDLEFLTLLYQDRVAWFEYSCESGHSTKGRQILLGGKCCKNLYVSCDPKQQSPESSIFAILIKL